MFSECLSGSGALGQTELTNRGDDIRLYLHLFTDLKWFNTMTKGAITSDGEDAEKLESSYTAGGKVKWYNHNVTT